MTQELISLLASGLAFGITAALGKKIIPWLHKLKYGQTIKEIGPKWHEKKQGTPTMGGIMFIAGILVSLIVCLPLYYYLRDGGSIVSNYEEPGSYWIRMIAGILMAVMFGAVGFLDDYIKVVKKQNDGLTPGQKMIFMTLISGAFLTTLAMCGDATVTTIPFFTNDVDAFYVADGHHRTAAAARVGAEKRAQNPNHTGDEEYNFFMAVAFPDSQLKILDYNRVVKDLNGLSSEEFLKALEKDFTVKEEGTEIYHPDHLHNFSMYLDGKWYSLEALPGRYDDKDPIGVLDVTILSNLVLDKLLGIKDLRTDKRIDFVGGIRGLGELSARVDSGEMKVAFALYPVSMKQLIDIADTGNIMPPKTTWFEPKLRSGLFIHSLD